MIYKVIETLPALDNIKSEPEIKTFESLDILEAKDLAEKYYIERFYKTKGKVELRFILKSNNQLHFLSEDYLMNSAKIEAKRIKELTGNIFIPVSWSDRHLALQNSYSKSK